LNTLMYDLIKSKDKNKNTTQITVKLWINYQKKE
jgi:hypothetical protein